ncbi:hypothetical protein SE17_08525, partial [Kouleothrix aurantiaca]
LSRGFNFREPLQIAALLHNCCSAIYRFLMTYNINANKALRPNTRLQRTALRTRKIAAFLNLE